MNEHSILYTCLCLSVSDPLRINCAWILHGVLWLGFWVTGIISSVYWFLSACYGSSWGISNWATLFTFFHLPSVFMPSALTYMPGVPKLQHASKSSAEFIKTEITGPTIRVHDSVGLGWSLRTVKFLGDGWYFWDMDVTLRSAVLC